MANNSTSSGLLAASAAVATRPSAITSVSLVGDGTNAATVIVYNNTAASGTVVAKLSVSSGQPHAFAHFDNPIDCSNGIYAAISGTGGGVVLSFLPQ